jgi:hypothetical protein
MSWALRFTDLPAEIHLKMYQHVFTEYSMSEYIFQPTSPKAKPRARPRLLNALKGKRRQRVQDLARRLGPWYIISDTFNKSLLRTCRLLYHAAIATYSASSTVEMRSRSTNPRQRLPDQLIFQKHFYIGNTDLQAWPEDCLAVWKGNQSWRLLPTYNMLSSLVSISSCRALESPYPKKNRSNMWSVPQHGKWLIVC